MSTSALSLRPLRRLGAATPTGGATLSARIVLTSSLVFCGCLAGCSFDRDSGNDATVEVTQSADDQTSGQSTQPSADTSNPSASNPSASNQSASHQSASNQAKDTSSPTANPSVADAAGTPSDGGASSAVRYGGMAEVPQGDVAWSGNGSLRRLQPPHEAASDTTHRVAFAVEEGLDVDDEAFMSFVVDTVNDARSWGHDGKKFAAVSDDPDFTVVLASPQHSAALCKPLQTFGKLSCRNGRTVVFTSYRWASGHADYGTDLIGYRRYLVNHEIGHFLGHGHKNCPGKGQQAPVMMQQTKGLKGCTTNSWPYPR